ncbi:MAG TPA: hypothetical protein VGL99_11315 [Chloroflexota bacterium]
MNFVQQARHHLVMEMRLIGIGRTKRGIEEIEPSNHTSGRLDIGRTQESIGCWYSNVPHPDAPEIWNRGSRVNNGASSNPRLIANNCALQHDRAGGYVTLGSNLTARQHAQRRNQGSIADSDGERRAARTAYRADDGSGEDDRLVAHFHRRAAAFKDNAVIDECARANMHIADKHRRCSDACTRMHERNYIVPADQHC